jgi:hypothetical protein
VVAGTFVAGYSGDSNVGPLLAGMACGTVADSFLLRRFREERVNIHGMFAKN